MSLPRSLVVWLAAAAFPGVALAQTANGSPTDPAPPGLVGTPRPISRTAPSVGAAPGVGVRRPGSDLPVATTPLPKPTAAERAEQRRLEHDLKICIGC